MITQVYYSYVAEAFTVITALRSGPVVKETLRFFVYNSIRNDILKGLQCWTNYICYEKMLILMFLQYNNN